MVKKIQVDACAVGKQGQIKYMLLHEGPSRKIPMGVRSTIVDLGKFNELVHNNQVYGFQSDKVNRFIPKYTEEELKNREKKNLLIVEGEDWYLNILRFNAEDVEKSLHSDFLSLSLLFTARVGALYVSQVAIYKGKSFTKEDIKGFKKNLQISKISRLTDNLYIASAATGFLELSLQRSSYNFGINTDVQSNLNSIYRRTLPGDFEDIDNVEILRVAREYKALGRG